MLDTYRKSGALGYVVAGAAILQCCLKRSKFNFQIKVLLIRFYRILGTIGRKKERIPFFLPIVNKLQLASFSRRCGGGL